MSLLARHKTGFISAADCIWRWSAPKFQLSIVAVPQECNELNKCQRLVVNWKRRRGFVKGKWGCRIIKGTRRCNWEGYLLGLRKVSQMATLLGQQHQSFIREAYQSDSSIQCSQRLSSVLAEEACGVGTAFSSSSRMVASLSRAQHSNLRMFEMHF
jgi:hypothetical protein